MWTTGELGLTTNKPEDLRPEIQSIQPKGWINEPRSRSRSRPVYSQTSVLHVSQQRDRPSHQRLSHLLRVKKENGPRLHKSFVAICTQRSPPHHAVEPSPPAILSILSFVFFTTCLPNQSCNTSGYYQSYHYATTNHPQHLPAPQKTYPPPPPQITPK
jgi:hypothetical protein